MSNIAIPFSTGTSGIEIAAGYGAADLLRIPNIDPMFHYRNKGNMFYKLLELIGATETVDQVKHTFFRDDRFATAVTASADYADSATTIVLNESGIAIPRMTLSNVATGENIYVSAVSGASLTVVRGHQGTTAAAISEDDVFSVLGAELPEGADAGSGVGKIAESDYALVSFFSETLAQTDVQKVANMLNQTGQIAGNVEQYQEKIMTQIDNALRRSARDIDTTTVSGSRLYSTGGFENTVTTNDITLTGTLTWKTLNTALKPLFDYTESSNQKYLLCGGTLFDQITNVSWDHFTAGNSTPTFLETLGATTAQIRTTSGGVLTLVRDVKGFDDIGLGGRGYIIDPAWIKKLTLEGFGAMNWRDVSRKEGHKETMEMFGSFGLKIVDEAMHGIINWSAS